MQPQAIVVGAEELFQMLGKLVEIRILVARLPGVEELPLQLQLAGQLMNVLAGLHSLDALPFELHGVTTPLRLLRHLLATPFDAKCVYSECLTLGVQSTQECLSAFICVHLRPFVFSHDLRKLLRLRTGHPYLRPSRRSLTLNARACPRP